MRSIVRSSLTRKVLVLGALGTTLVASSPSGCSSPAGVSEPGSTEPGTRGAPSAENTGSVGMQLTLPGGEQINSVSWKVTGPNGASTVVQSGVVMLNNSTTISFLVGGIPAGSNYFISLTGTSADSTTTCSGGASFNTTPRTTTNVAVTLQCNTAASEAGSALVTAGTFNCGTVTAMSASPDEVIVGSSIALSAAATGPNQSGLTYQWTAPSGSFDSATSASPHYTCGVAGPVTLSLTVGDGPVPMGGACNTTMNTSSIQVTCDGGLQNDIQNIVFIYAENRSFDGLFGNYPGANGLAQAAMSPHPQLDRDGVTVLSTLPPAYGGATAAGNPTVITQAQTMGLPNAPFEMETAFATLNSNPALALTTADVTHDLAHRFFENQMEINGGTNDGFAAWEDVGGLTMGHFDYSHSALWTLAQQNVLADNFFMGAFGGSFLNHQYLICGCAPTAPLTYPTTNSALVTTLGTPNAKGVVQLATKSTSPTSALGGAVAYLQSTNVAPLDYFGAGDGYRLINTMQPPYQPSGNAASTGAPDLRYANPLASTTVPPQTQTTIGDLLSGQGIDWAWYAQDWTTATADGLLPLTSRSVIYFVPPGMAKGIPDFQAHHHAFNYYAAFDPVTHAGDRAAHLKDYTDLVAAATAGTLPAVAFYKPAGYQNQHPGYANVDDGDAHLVSVVNALKASPQWNHMVIVITWDEYGGQWDHVAPPKGDLLGPGSRIPALIISPYAKAGTVDHTPYDTASILRLITHRFALPTLPGLTARDAALVANGGTAMGDLTNALTLP